MGYGYVARRRVVVNLKTGTAISGVITRSPSWWRGPFYVLRDATVHEGGQSMPADGEMLVEKVDVDYIQAPV